MYCILILNIPLLGGFDLGVSLSQKPEGRPSELGCDGHRYERDVYAAGKGEIQYSYIFMEYKIYVVNKLSLPSPSLKIPLLSFRVAEACSRPFGSRKTSSKKERPTSPIPPKTIQCSNGENVPIPKPF